MPARAIPLTLLAFSLALLFAISYVAPATGAALPEPATTPLPGGMSVDGFIYRFTPADETLYAHGDFSYLGERVGGLTVLDADGRIPPELSREPESDPLDFTRRIISDGTDGWFINRAPGSPEAHGVARVGGDLRPLAGWPVGADGAISDLALRDGVLYLAGSFANIAGQPRAGLAALDAAAGTLLPWTAAGASGSYHRIAAGDLELFASRQFLTDGSIVAFTRDTGAARDWAPAISGNHIERMYVEAGQLFVAGDVASDGADGVPGSADDAQGLVILDPASGAALGPPLRLDPQPTLMLQVSDIALGADTIYLAGTFAAVNGQPRAGLAAIDRATGAVRDWRADLEYRPEHGQGPIAIANALSLDGDTLYVGGVFERAGGHRRRNLAALSAATGTPLAWQGSVNRSVYSIAAAGGRTAVSGIFTLAGGQPGADAVAIDIASGLPLPWEARHSSGASTIDPDFGRNASGVTFVAPLGEQLYLADSGPEQLRILALDRGSGAIQQWDGLTDAEGAVVSAGEELIVSRRGGANSTIIAAYPPLGASPRWERPITGATVQELLVSETAVYGAISAAPGSRLFALSLADGTLIWEHTIRGAAGTLALDGDTLYLGGAFDQVGETAGSNLMALDAASGSPLPWPAELAPDGEVYDLAITEGRLYVGGLFTAIGPTERPGVAAIDLGAAPALAAWSPQLPAGAFATAALALTDKALYTGTTFEVGEGQGIYSILVYPMGAASPMATPAETTSATPAGTPLTPTSTTSLPSSATAAPSTPTAAPATSTSEPAGTVATPTLGVHRLYLQQLQ